ncbi:MAG TPA: hypothetical protein VFK32_10085 [Tepidiformaceae bacterium]|nr:hypothetical protein [Tepidiformaceae bacterium]
MRTALVLLLAVSLVITFADQSQPASAVEVVVTVTSTADTLVDEVCPDETKCTLRAAIEFVNLDEAEAGGPYTIVFDPEVFPPEAPETITVGAIDLPEVTQDTVTIDASAAGVVIRGGGAASVGLNFSGASSGVAGLVVQDFATACIEASGISPSVGGDIDENEGNRLGGCPTAILFGPLATNATADGNVIGFDTDGTAAGVSVGIEANGEDAVIGGAAANLIGNAATGIVSSAPGATLRRNTIGFDPDGVAAPVTTGIMSESADALIGNTTSPVASNLIGNATTGILTNGGDAVLIGNRIGFDPDGAPAPVIVGIAVEGESADLGEHLLESRGNRVGNAEIGIRITGEGAALYGNIVGLAPNNSAAPVEIGISVEAANATLGDEEESDDGNTVGNAVVGIRVGTEDGDGELFTGVRILQNWIGRTQAGPPHPVETGVLIRQPSLGTEVTGNYIANTTGSGIVASANIGDDSTSGVFEQNIFAGIGGLSIDLNADGIRNPNDTNDTDLGPNGLLNHPVITLATQAEISGTTSPACVGAAGLCTVFLYNTDHVAGGDDDFATTPIPLGSVTTDSAGEFTFPNPPVAPGKWIVAIVTLHGGGTSEVGPSARVGTGSVACGNVPLYFGWNHAPYFGAQTLQLGLSFPAGSGESDVSAIFKLTDGTSNYTSWFADTVIGRTLATLIPGEPYWYYAAENTLIPGGFAVTQAVPVDLEAGWNDFVYLGASTDAADALASIAGEYNSVYRYVNDGFTEHWELYAGPDAPAFINDFTTVQACGSYWVNMDDEATLTPPHP